MLLSRAWGCADAVSSFFLHLKLLGSKGPKRSGRPDLQELASELCFAGGVPAGLPEQAAK